jgi:DsbC/DsbD-like thiol-disulfide interchange protein/cytochrome c biogenesis protein CcdA
MRSLVPAVGLALAAAWPLAAAAAADDRHVDVELVAQTRTPAAGSTTTLAIVMAPQPGWHGYWSSPGDAGLPTTLKWTLPPGVRAGAPAYPVPGTLLAGGVMNHVYAAPYAMLVALDLPAGLTDGTPLAVALKLDYLACTSDLCVPESREVSTQLTVGQGAPDPAIAARMAAWRAALPRPLEAAVRFEIAGGRFRVGVPLPAATTLTAPHLFSATDGAIGNAARQTFERRGDLVVIETEAGPRRPSVFEGVLALGDGRGVSFTAGPGRVGAGGPQPSAGASGAVSWTSTVVALAGALLGGLLLNVMPCVFPILSLKAFSLARAGGREREARSDALAYAAGTMLVCAALGGAVLALRSLGAAAGWAFQLQHPAVVLVLILLTTAIGLNFAGLYELGTVSGGEALAARGGTAGAFWTGALAAFVATPCTGPFMAAALGSALLLPWPQALLVFVGLGLGLALPFLALGYLPGLRRRLPRPGPWMQTFRSAMAIPMFATVLGLEWILGRQADADGAVLGMGAAVLLAIGLWMTGIRQRAQDAWAWWPASAALVLALACVAGLPAAAPVQPPAPSGLAALPFDAARLAALREARMPVFLYFSADWCLTCQVNERVAIERDETRQAFLQGHVAVMRGDWTRGDAAIGRFIADQGRAGIPLYIWYAPGAAPRLLPQILDAGLLIGLARGGQ